jgi:hypothetical protein
MKTNNRLKSVVIAVAVALASLLVPSGASAVDSQRMAQTQAVRQTREERFDKILQMARIQYARIEEWQKKAKAHDHQKRALQKTRSAVAMKE